MSEQEQVATQARGWTWVIGATKWHYFRSEDSDSAKGFTPALCGRWGLFRLPVADLEDNGDDSPDNCKLCGRKVKAMRAREQQGEAAKVGGE